MMRSTRKFLILLCAVFAASCGQHRHDAFHLAEQATEAMRNSDWRHAELLLTQAVEADSRFAEAHMVRGLALEHLQRTDEAQPSYKTALDIYSQRIHQKPQEFQLYVSRAFLKLVMDDPAGMESDLALAIEHGLEPAVADVIRLNATQELQNWRSDPPRISINDLAG